MLTFEDIAERYESWYGTPQGHGADTRERALLGKLLATLPEARTVLEVGCCTCHFTRWLTTTGRRTVGLDVSPAMLSQACQWG